MSGGIASPVFKILTNITAGNPNGNPNGTNPEFNNNGNETNIEEVVLRPTPKPINMKMGDLIIPGVPDINIPDIGDEIKLNNYSQTYTTGEDKLHLYKFGDPLTLNFKLIMDYDRKSGLFADESHPDSALAFLKRIGEDDRYDMLKHWINVFKSLVKDFDFLFLNVDGLDIVQNKPNHEYFLDKEKIKLTLRETTDMLVQSLLVTYNNIVYDKIRKVTVLPSNLRKFDCYIVVFSAGYYNILFHDVDKNNPDNLDRKVLPTKHKLADEVFNINSIGSFNHTLYEFVSCSLDFESGSMFADSVSNEMSGDYVKNNITFTYKFATFSGTYNNIMGDNNWYSILAQAAAENKIQNLARFQYIKNASSSGFVADGKDFLSSDNLKAMLGNTVLGSTLDNIKQFGNKDTYKNIFNSIKTNTLTKLEDKLVNQLPVKLLGPHSVIGQTLSKINPNYVTNMIQNTVDLGIGKLQDLYDTGVTSLNNLILTNYNDNLADVYNNVFAKYKPTNDIEVINQGPSKPYYDENPNNNFTDPNPYTRPNTFNYDPTLDDVKFKAGIKGANYDPTLDDDKFIKGTNGLSFFGDKNEEQGKFKSESKNLYVRRGF